MANVLEVVNPGPLATLQDLGRPGWMKYGVPPSGALDREAYKAAIEAAVKAEVEYLAQITESGKVKGMGGAPADGDSGKLLETWKAKYLSDGYDDATAEKLAAIASGR